MLSLSSAASCKIAMECVVCGGDEGGEFLRGAEANRIAFLFCSRGELPTNWASVARTGLIRKWHVLWPISSHFFLPSLLPNV